MQVGGTWGFKATPVCGYTMAHTIARDDNHPLIRAFNLSRLVPLIWSARRGAASVGH